MPYEVGYGKPPAAHRFRHGQSGNPNGRPKGARNRPAPPAAHQRLLKSIIMEEAYRPVPVTDAKGTTAIQMAAAVMRSVAVNAAKGNARSQRLFTDLLSATVRESRREEIEALEAMFRYKLAWEQELERRARLGIVAPDPVPHPDHVIIDPDASTARIVGPATKEEKVAWDQWIRAPALLEDENKEIQARLDDPDCPHRDELEAELAKSDKALTILRLALGGSRHHWRALLRHDVAELYEPHNEDFRELEPED